MLINLTPHVVRVITATETREFPSAGIARVEDSREPMQEIEGVPLTGVRAGRVTGLPEPSPGTFLIVSRITAQALPERPDLLFPFDEIRDESGSIIGVRTLARWLEDS